MSGPTTDPSELQALGFTILRDWDHDEAVTNVVDGWQNLRRTQPKLARTLRAAAFDLRTDLHADLPGVPSEYVERVALALMAKLGALTIRLGADAYTVGMASTVASLAVVDGVWPAQVSARGDA